MPPFRLDADNPMNLGVIRYLAERAGEEQVNVIVSPGSAAHDPYWHMGSHPETVERVWDQLGSILPETCCCLLYGTPALVAPTSGIVLAIAFGTAYALRVPEVAVPAAIEAGATTITRWSGGGQLNVTEQFGSDWIFGRWLKDEPRWCLECFRAVEGTQCHPPQ
jgi:hypothetical protein